MNEDILKGKWHEVRGSVKTKWGKLTDDDLTAISGQTEKLLGLLQTRYGYAKEKAEEEYKTFVSSLKK
ncbi:MAG: CsbD family protein [Negativicutes bacterium]